MLSAILSSLKLLINLPYFLFKIISLGPPGQCNDITGVPTLNDSTITLPKPSHFVSK